MTAPLGGLIAVARPVARDDEAPGNDAPPAGSAS